MTPGPLGQEVIPLRITIQMEMVALLQEMLFKLYMIFLLLLFPEIQIFVPIALVKLIAQQRCQITPIIGLLPVLGQALQEVRVPIK